MGEINTKRLVLRSLCADDAAVIATLAGDFQVARQTARIPHPFCLDDARAWIASLAYGDKIVHGITLNGQLIGTTGYEHEKPDSVEIRYWLGRDFWGNGFASEAAGAIIHAIFDKSEINIIIAGHAIDNPASRRVIEKLGFRLIGETIYYSLARGEDVPCLLHQLHRDEYLEQNAS